ncbi:MAG TPA: DUF805 domain-containing protein [Arthrobacter sp.]|nr:DUF805 domain-containing protein [Arthrobacter sp.]
MSYPQYPQPQAQQQTFQVGEPPLWAPYYGAPFPAAVKRFFKKYATFSGRASRSEFWWWALVSFAVSLVLNIITAATTTASMDSAPALGAGSILAVLWGLATLVPSLALLVRRLHDGGFSGLLALLLLVPFLGALAVLVLTILPSKPEGQKYDQPAAV